MKNLLIPILSLAILTSTAPSIFANEHEDREHAEDQEVGDREGFEGEEEETEILERNIRIEFKLLPLEDNDRGVYVITASPSYATHVESSARLIAAQAFEAASMGEKTLVIRASYADTTPK